MPLRRLNPFASLPNPREVWAWGMYDLANQSFQLLINTLLFGIYLAEYVAPEPTRSGAPRGEAAWAAMIGASLILVVLASPILGAIADARSLRKEFLVLSGLGAVVLTAALAAVGPGMLWLAAVLYIAAAFLVGIGENFLASFLPQLATPATMGRVSAIGWTMSYVGALLLLGLTAAAVFGLGATHPQQWRWLFVAAAAWFLLGMIPTILFVRETIPPAPPPASGDAPRAGSLLTIGFRRLGTTIREARRYRQLMRFLAVFFVYSMGTMSVVFYAGIIGKRLGFGIGQLTLLALVMALSAGAGSVFAARYQDRLGHRRTVRLYLAVWVVSTLALAITEMRQSGAAATGGAPMTFWLISAGIGLGLGGIGTASRALVGCFTPAPRSAEFFGLWGMVYKLAGVAGPLAFSAVTTLIGATYGLFLLSAFFAAGLLLMACIDEREGIARAAQTDPLTSPAATSPPPPPHEPAAAAAPPR